MGTTGGTNIQVIERYAAGSRRRCKDPIPGIHLSVFGARQQTSYQADAYLLQPSADRPLRAGKWERPSEPRMSLNCWNGAAVDHKFGPVGGVSTIRSHEANQVRNVR